MSERKLGSLGSTSLWRAGPPWRRRFLIRCEECGALGYAATSEIGWLRVRSHRAAHQIGAAGHHTDGQDAP